MGMWYSRVPQSHHDLHPPSWVEEYAHPSCRPISLHYSCCSGRCRCNQICQSTVQRFWCCRSTLQRFVSCALTAGIDGVRHAVPWSFAYHAPRHVPRRVRARATSTAHRARRATRSAPSVSPWCQGLSAPSRVCAAADTECLRGWRNTVGNLIDICLAPKSLSPASFYWYMREQQRGTVSSNSRFQTALLQQCSASLSTPLASGTGRRASGTALPYMYIHIHIHIYIYIYLYLLVHDYYISIIYIYILCIVLLVSIY